MGSQPVEQLESDPRWYSGMRPGECGAPCLARSHLATCRHARAHGWEGTSDSRNTELLRDRQGEVVKAVEASVRALIDGELDQGAGAAGVAREVRRRIDTLFRQALYGRPTARPRHVPARVRHVIHTA